MNANENFLLFFQGELKVESFVMMGWLPVPLPVEKSFHQFFTGAVLLAALLADETH